MPQSVGAIAHHTRSTIDLSMFTGLIAVVANDTLLNTVKIRINISYKNRQGNKGQSRLTKLETIPDAGTRSTDTIILAPTGGIQTQNIDTRSSTDNRQQIGLILQHSYDSLERPWTLQEDLERGQPC